MTLSMRNILLATVAGLSLVACSGGSVSSPGDAGPVTVNPGGGSGGGTSVDLDLVPNDTCPTGTTLETVDINGSTIESCTITGTLTSNLTLTAENAYSLEGPVFVGEDGGAVATLTIPAGTTIYGKSGQDYLVVSRGSRVNAQGTASEPIIMTAAADLQGTVYPVNDQGLWGGLIVNGNAPINDCNVDGVTGGSADCEKSGEGASGLFGGDNPNDNSGIYQYLQVKYAGNLINDEDELNGIAFQGVGSGTTCDHIQVHNNADDGIEFFGGNIECKYLILTGIGDDSIDWTDGWQGKIQYALVQQGEATGDRGIEADNREGDNDVTPRSNPSVANLTFVGGASGDTGMVLRRGTAGRYCNAIMTGFQDAGIDVDSTSTLNLISSGDLTIESFFLDNADNVESGDSGETFDLEAYFNGAPNNVQGNSSLVDSYIPGAAESAVAACDLSDDGFFENVDYIGAFGPTESPDSNWASGWSFGLFEDPTECPAGTLDTGETVNNTKVCELAGTITSNTRLNNNFLYQLDGAVFIGEDVGGDAANPDTSAASAILTIDAGTTIFGRSGQDYLVVSRGSQLRSNGTATAPVVMTSRKEVLNEDFDPVNDRGEWGGLVINGRAPINDCSVDGIAGGAADCEKSGEGSSGLFGGNSPTDNSGNLFYTRVSFAGNLINDEDELNGIAFQGVGSGTQVDFVQVHNNVDDGVEMFGGKVNLKHLVLTGIGDDSVDWTDGWQGNAQFVIVQQASDVGDRGIEADNREGNDDVTPRSNPNFSNFTFIGGASGDTGMVLRRGTAGNFMNGIITGFQDAGLDIDSASTAALATAGDITFDSILLVENNANLESDDATEDAAQNGAFAAGSNNVDSTGNSTLSGSPAVIPGANESAVPATDPTAFGSFFDDVDYIGAVRDADDTWYQGWTLLVTE